MEDERKPLLQAGPPQQDSTNEGDDSIIPFDPNVILPRRKWIVEPLILLCCVSLLGQSPVASQYLYYRVGLSYNVTTNNNLAFQCNTSDSSVNSTEKHLINKIQDEASTWGMYNSFISSIIALFLTFFYASFSDLFGRRWAILLPTFGYMIFSLLSLCVIVFNLPLYVFVIANGITGLFGGFGTLFAGVFAYLSDITSKKDRPIRIAIVEGMFGIGGSLVEFGIGWLIKWQGYTVSYIVSTTFICVAFLYALFGIPEVRRGRPGEIHNVKDVFSNFFVKPIKNIIALFSFDNHRLVIYLLSMISMFFFVTCFMGSMTLTNLYEMNYPFCLDSVYLGYFSGIKIIAYQIGMILAVKLLHPTLNPLSLILLGLLSSCGSYVMLGLATNNAMLFIVPCVGIFSMLPIPMWRALCSQLTPSNKQGALFASISVAEVSGNLVGSVVYLLLYKYTLPWFAGFVFIVMASVTMLSFILTTINKLFHTKVYQKYSKTIIDDVSQKK